MTQSSLSSCRALRRAGLLVLLLIAGYPEATAAQTQSITLEWDPNTEPDLSGYVLRYGTQPGVHTNVVDVGNQTTWTIEGLHEHQRYYFVVQAYNTGGMYSAPSTEVTNDGLVVQTGGSLPDQKPSVFWQHQTSGELMTWHLNGATVVDTRKISIDRVGDTNWKVSGTGDLNADGHTDLVWRHETEGWLAVWFLQNNQVVGTYYLSINRITDPNWKIRGVGDVDGDRHADLVWQHTDGWLAVWLMRGTTVAGTHFLSIPRVAEVHWKVAAVADVTGDGRADLIWQSTEGWLAFWALNGTSVALTQFLSIDRISDSDWKLQAAIDDDGTGVAKLVWRRTSDGQIGLWSLRGATVFNTVVAMPERIGDADWKIVGGR